MTNPRIEKVKLDIGKTKTKISEYQSKLRVLERQKIDLENEEIIARVRSEKISDAELATLMASLRREEPDAVSGESAVPAAKTTIQEDIDDENLDED